MFLRIFCAQFSNSFQMNVPTISSLFSCDFWENWQTKFKIKESNLIEDLNKKKIIKIVAIKSFALICKFSNHPPFSLKHLFPKWKANMEVPYKNHNMNSTNEASYQNINKMNKRERENKFARPAEIFCWYGSNFLELNETFQKTLLLLYSVWDKRKRNRITFWRFVYVFPFRSIGRIWICHSLWSSKTASISQIRIKSLISH